MSEQTNAELIDEARQLIRHSSVSAPEHANMLGRLAAALEAAEQRADQAEATAEHLHDEDTREIVALTQERDALAAVVEKVRVFIERQSGWFRYRAEPVSTVLASAGADVLREHDAKVRAEEREQANREPSDAEVLARLRLERLEAVEDFITRHYLDTQMGERVLAIVNGIEEVRRG